MGYEIKFHPKANEDFSSLSPQLANEAQKEIDALEKNPLRGEPLHGNLRTCRKIYFHKKKMRIVYRIEGNVLKIEEITGVNILVIGERKRKKVYEMALKRLLGE